MQEIRKYSKKEVFLGSVIQSGNMKRLHALYRVGTQAFPGLGTFLTLTLTPAQVIPSRLLPDRRQGLKNPSPRALCSASIFTCAPTHIHTHTKPTGSRCKQQELPSESPSEKGCSHVWRSINVNIKQHGCKLSDLSFTRTQK